MFSSFRNQQPLFWLSGRPVHTVSFLLSLYIVATIGVAFLMATGRHDLVQLFVYNSTAVAHGELWRLVTYAFVNTPSIWFALELGMIFFFGRLVEAGIGSRPFAVFYGGLIVLQGMLFQLAHFFGHPSEAHGMEMVSLALFAAFVAMVPSAPFFFGIAARWMLLLLLGLSALQLLAERQWISMLQLLTLAAAAVFFMKKKGFQEKLYFFSSNELANLMKQSLSKPVTLPPPEMQAGDRHFTGSTLIASLPTKGLKKSKSSLPSLQQETKDNLSMIHVDQLLDKISETGISSLTAQEKEKLEAARVALLKRDQAD